MNRAEYHRLLLALKEDPNCLGKFREKYRNIYRNQGSGLRD